MTSTGHTSSIKSIENITKAVMHLPKNVWVSFCIHINAKPFNEGNINLNTFEKWLANKIHATLNPIATLIEDSIRSKNKGNQDKSNKFNTNNIH